MPARVWTHSIQLIDLYDKYEETDDFITYGKAVVKRLEETKLIPPEYLQQLNDAISTDDVDEWDEAFSDVYDFCDENRIWLVVKG